MSVTHGGDRTEVVFNKKRCKVRHEMMNEVPFVLDQQA